MLRLAWVSAALFSAAGIHRFVVRYAAAVLNYKNVLYVKKNIVKCIVSYYFHSGCCSN